MPTAHELKNGPGMTGTGARNAHATKPKRNAVRESVRAIRRTTVPVRAAEANSTNGSTTKKRAASGPVPKIVIPADASHSSPQWYQVWAGAPTISGKPDGNVLVSVPVVARSRPRTA